MLIMQNLTNVEKQASPPPPGCPEFALLVKLRPDLARCGACVGGVSTVHSCFVTCFSVVSQPGRFLGHQVSLLRCVCWWPYLRSDCPIKPSHCLYWSPRGGASSRQNRQGPIWAGGGRSPGWHGCPSLYVSKSRTHRGRVSLYLLQGHLPD